MTYIDLKEKLRDYLIFSLADIRKIGADFDRRRLNEWQDKGYIKKIRRGFYIFSDSALSEPALFLIANKIYPPSYISFEMAFSFYNLIPESVYGITSATTKKTISFKSQIGEFIYRKIKPSLMFGYKLESFQNQNYKIAEIEKAVLDYLYINPQIQSDADFFELRFNSQEFLAKADMQKFNQYLKVFKNKSLEKRAEKFLEFIKK
jgi:predicted transcriptional regulator of viral defense system